MPEKAPPTSTVTEVPASRVPALDTPLQESSSRAVRPSGRVSPEEKMAFLSLLSATGYGAKLNNRQCYETFSSMGAALSPSGFSARTQEIVALTEKGSDRRSLSLAVYRGLLYELAQRLPEEQRRAFASEDLTLRKQLEALKDCPASLRKIFVRGLVSVILGGKGERAFFQAQLPAILHFVSPQERAQLFGSIWLRPRNRHTEKLTGEALTLILRSSQDLNELAQVTANVRRSLLLKSRFPGLKDFLAWVEIGAAMRLREPVEIPGKRAGPEEIQRAYRSILADLDEREGICRSYPELAKSPVTRRFLRICSKNRKLLTAEFKLKKGQSERAEILELASAMMKIEFHFAIPFTSERPENGKSLSLWKKEEVEQIGKALRAMPEGLIIFAKNITEFKRALKDADDPDAMAEYSERSGAIEIYNYATTAATCRTMPRWVTFLIANFFHEVGHASAVGTYKNTTIVSQRHPVMTEMIRNEISRNGECSSSYIIDVLKEAESFAHAGKVVHAAGRDALIERAEPALLEILARIDTGKALEGINWPAKLPRSAGRILVAKRETELEEALLAMGAACEDEPAFANCHFTRDNLDFSREALAVLRSRKLEDLPLAKRRRNLDILSEMGKLASRYGVSFNFPDAPLSASFDLWNEQKLARLSRLKSTILRGKAPPLPVDPMIRLIASPGFAPDRRQALSYDREKASVYAYLGGDSHGSISLRPSGVTAIASQISRSQRPLDRGIDRLVSERAERIIGATDPWLHFKGLLDLGGWEPIARSRFTLLESAGRSLLLDGVPRLADTPYLIDGKLKALTYDHGMLFKYDIGEHTQFDSNWYNRQSPWEWVADHLRNYFMRPKYGIQWSPLVMDALEARFRFLADKPTLLGMLDREIEAARKRPPHFILRQFLSGIPRTEVIEAIEGTLGDDMKELARRYLASCSTEERCQLMEEFQKNHARED